MQLLFKRLTAMATHFQIIEKMEDFDGNNVDNIIWSTVVKGDKLSFTDSLMFDIFKNKGKVVMLTKWTQGESDITILKRSWVN